MLTQHSRRTAAGQRWLPRPGDASTQPAGTLATTLAHYHPTHPPTCHRFQTHPLSTHNPAWHNSPLPCPALPAGRWGTVEAAEGRTLMPFEVPGARLGLSLWARQWLVVGHMVLINGFCIALTVYFQASGLCCRQLLHCCVAAATAGCVPPILYLGGLPGLGRAQHIGLLEGRGPILRSACAAGRRQRCGIFCTLIVTTAWPHLRTQARAHIHTHRHSRAPPAAGGHQPLGPGSRGGEPQLAAPVVGGDCVLRALGGGHALLPGARCAVLGAQTAAGGWAPHVT